MLNFWLISSIVCIGIAFIVAKSVSMEIKEEFTIIKKPKTHWSSTLRAIIIMSIPFVNIGLALIMLFGFNKMVEYAVVEYKQKGYIE